MARHGDLPLVYCQERNNLIFNGLASIQLAVEEIFFFFGLLCLVRIHCKSLQFIHTYTHIPVYNSVGRMPARLQCKKGHSLTNQLYQGKI